MREGFKGRVTGGNGIGPLLSPQLPIRYFLDAPFLRVSSPTVSDMKPGSTTYAKVAVVEVVDPGFEGTGRFADLGF